MSLIMGQIEPEQLELLSLEFGKIAQTDFYTLIIYKYKPISTKLSQNVCDHKMSYDFDYECNWTRTV